MKRNLGARIHWPELMDKIASTAEAASLIRLLVGMSGFTLAGGAKAVPLGHSETRCYRAVHHCQLT